MESLSPAIAGRISEKDNRINYSCKLINTILHLCYMMSEKGEGSYTCSDCGASFSTHQGLVNHNVDIHGAAVGVQLRQSEEIQKQRREE